MFDPFGKTFACDCGKTHRVEPVETVYAADALAQLSSICGRATKGRRAAVLMDARTEAVAGRAAARALAADGWTAQAEIVPDPPGGKSPVCDEKTQAALEARLPDCDLLVAVGSGVISDLGKWIAFDRNTAFVVYATAASMNGYASANVAPTVGGVKTLVRARPPYAVVADPRVIAEAPWELTASGLGDLLAKPVSSADWLMNHLLFGDYYCNRAVGLIAEIEPLYLENPQGLAARQPRAIEALFRGLLLTGAAITMAETSAPSSGGEHMIGHTLDMMSSLDGVPHDLHGRQVGVGTILAAELYRRVLAIESPVFPVLSEGMDRPFWGRLAPEVSRHCARKAPRLRSARDSLSSQGRWDDLRRRAAELLRPPETVRDCLRRAGAAYRAEDIGCGRERLLAALLHAHEIRDRFTILDLARLAGVLPAAAGEIIEQSLQ